MVKTRERMYVMMAKLNNMLKAMTAGTQYPAWIQKLKDDGRFVAAGKWSDNSGGLLIFRAESLEEAMQVVKDDPLVKNNAVNHEVKEWDANFDFEPTEY